MMLSAEEAKEIYTEELKDYGLDSPSFWESSVGYTDEILHRYIGINIPQKGNSAVIKFLTNQGWTKQRRVSNRRYGAFPSREPHEFIIQMRLEVSL